MRCRTVDLGNPNKGNQRKIVMNTQSKVAKSLVAVVLVSAGVLLSAEANAQERDSVSSDKTAPVQEALELKIGTGYTQGLGDIGSRQPKLTQLGTAGADIQAGIGGRIIPQLSLGVYGTMGLYGREEKANPNGHNFSSTAGVQADWHFLPSGSEFDPWVSLGTGWRAYWLTGDTGSTTMHGLELGKLQVGVDYRVDKQVAISPVVGIDLSTFLTQATPESHQFHNISSPNVNTFLFAGLQGRFDIPTGPDSFPRQVASR